MSSERQTARAEWLESWAQRELRFIEAAPFILLAVASGLDVAVRGGLGSKTRIDLGLAAATAVVMLGVVRLRRSSIERPLPLALLFAGVIGLGAALVVRAPIFGFYTFTGYFWAFRVLPGRAVLVGVAAVAVLSAIAQSGGAPALTIGGIGLFLVVFAINAGVAGLVTWFGWVGNEQRVRRQQAIEELTETNRRLEETLTENAALQAQLLTQAREAGVSEERRRMRRPHSPGAAYAGGDRARAREPVRGASLGSGDSPRAAGDRASARGAAGRRRAVVGVARGTVGSAGSDGGFGLAAMRQRIQGVAGTLEIESEPDSGTAISASVPAVLAGTAR